jgi:hypothetical protein
MTKNFTDVEIEERYEQSLAISANGDDVTAVCAFAELIFRTPDGERVIFAEHHRSWIAEILSNKRVVIVAPPESAKTTVTMALMAWWIGKHPYTSNLIVSAGETIANSISMTIANIIDFHPGWKLTFPHVRPDKKGGWSRDGYSVIDTSMSMEDWRTRISGRKDPTLIGGGVTSSHINGRRVTGLALADDIHDRQSKDSDLVCNDTVSFMKDTFIPRVMEDAHLVIVQTRWNPKDVVGYLSSVEVDNKSMYQIFIHPAIHTDTGKSYWPEQWPLERLERRRAEIGEVDFKLVYLSIESAAEGQWLRAEWLRDYPHLMFKHEYDRYIGIDFAQKIQQIVNTKNRDPDFFALAVIVNTNPILVVEDGYEGRIIAAEAEDVFFQYAAQYNPIRSGIEVNRDGVDYYQALIRRMNLRGVRYALIPITTKKNILRSMNEMAPDFQVGMVKVSDEQLPFLKRFRDQWVKLGARNMHDDVLKAVHLAWQTAAHLLPRKSHARIVQERDPLFGNLPALSPAQQIDRAYFGDIR